jgi:hypothetical protein
MPWDGRNHWRVNFDARAFIYIQKMEEAEKCLDVCLPFLNGTFDIFPGGSIRRQRILRHLSYGRHFYQGLLRYLSVDLREGIFWENTQLEMKAEFLGDGVWGGGEKPLAYKWLRHPSTTLTWLAKRLLLGLECPG